MKTCVSSYSFLKYMKETGCDLFAVADKAKELGFDAIEFTELPGDDKRAGYDGYVSLEFEGMEKNIPALAAGLAYLKKVIA